MPYGAGACQTSDFRFEIRDFRSQNSDAIVPERAAGWRTGWRQFPVRCDELPAAVGAGSDKLQLAGREIAPGDRHGSAGMQHWAPKRRASLCASRQQELDNETISTDCSATTSRRAELRSHSRRSRMRHIKLALCVLIIFVRASIAQNVSRSIEHKSQIAWVFWEWEDSPEQWSKDIQLSAEEKKVAAQLATKRQRDKKLGLLLALNCVSSSRYQKLEEYLCRGGADVSALREVVSTDVTLLAFAKPVDRPAAMAFLERYIAFWKNEAKIRDASMPLGESELEAIEETLLFLQSGGYNKPSSP